jgi:hypothetical protein
VAVFAGHNAYSTWRDIPIEIRDHFYISFGTSSNRFWNKSFDSARYIIMLTETRDMLSLVLYLADTTPCTIYVIVQDEIDLIGQGLEKKAVLALLTGFVVPLLSIIL